MSFLQYPNSDILALYHLEDVNDSSGNSHTLTNNNSVTFANGKFGNAAIFGNANSSKYLKHGDALGKDLSGDAGVSAWFMLQTLPASGEMQVIARWASTVGTARYFNLVYINDAGTKKLRAICSGTGDLLDYAIDLSENVWYKLDFNFGATCELFLNGYSIGTLSKGTSTTTFDNVVIGATYTSGAASYFKGNIDEAVFFNDVRTVADILRRYAFERGMLV